MTDTDRRRASDIVEHLDKVFEIVDATKPTKEVVQAVQAGVLEKAMKRFGAQAIVTRKLTGNAGEWMKKLDELS